MPIRKYRRRTYKNKKYRTVRRKVGRGYKRYKVPRVGGIHYFKAKSQLTSIDPSNVGGEIARQYQFNITQISNLSEYQALFDQYKICAVKIEFRIKRQPGALGTSSSLPVMASVIDRDGTPNVENTYGNLLVREGVRVTYFSDNVPYIKYYFKPRCLLQTINGDFTTNPPTFTSSGRAIVRPQWQDFGVSNGAAAPAQQHYGLLVNVPGLGVGTSGASIDVYQTLYFKCRNQV